MEGIQTTSYRNRIAMLRKSARNRHHANPWDDLKSAGQTQFTQAIGLLQRSIFIGQISYCFVNYSRSCY